MNFMKLMTVGVTAVITVALAVPASAQTTAATVTVSGGTLSISAPAQAGNLGTADNTVLDDTISGQLGEVQVNDARGTAAGGGWVASVISTAFTKTTAPATAIPATAVGYEVGPIAKVGTATYVGTNSNGLTGVVVAVTASGITGDNSATWTPTINVAVPGSAGAGVYAATITHSVV